MCPIVLVDDSPEDLLLAERVLRQCKVCNPILTLTDGRDCMAYFEKKARENPQPVPCLLLLDLVMAPVDGLAVLRVLKEKNLAVDSVVVMVSGLTDIKAIHQGYQLGARTFLVKPISRTDILQMLNSLKGLCIQEVEEGYALSIETASNQSGLRNKTAPVRIQTSF